MSSQTANNVYVSVNVEEPPAAACRPLHEFAPGTVVMKAKDKHQHLYMVVDSRVIAFKMTGDVGMKMVFAEERFYVVDCDIDAYTPDPRNT
jgi:hypothetical protein